ncbi:MAG TPA: hypothetical protein VF692_09645 [Pyrinomonadaceae bacterium]
MPGISFWDKIINSRGPISARPATFSRPPLYDGDGRADPAIYRPSNNVWYMLHSRAVLPPPVSGQAARFRFRMPAFRKRIGNFQKRLDFKRSQAFFENILDLSE